MALKQGKSLLSASNIIRVAGAGLALLCAACATINSTPEAPQVAQNERAAAAKQHPQILAQFGGAVRGPSAIYVNVVGQKIANAAGLPGQCVFSVVNSEVVNAFAVPGCYIYVTRGLLAIMNSEDELASVLGHEVGHVAAAHSARRQNTALAATLGAVLAGVLTGSGEIAQAAGQLGQVYALGYSREQEFEADDLGVRYLGAAGYNQFAAADMLNALGANDALTAKTNKRDAAQSTPAWARTHPLSAERVTRAIGRAQAAGALRDKPPELIQPYFEAIRGLTYGDDPEQGFVSGRAFAHPKLKIAFEAPEGYSLTNTPASILIAGAGGKAQFSGGVIQQSGLDAYAAQTLQSVLGQARAELGQHKRTYTNGLETVIAPALTQNQSGRILSVVVYAYRVDEGAYSFVTLTAASAAQPFAPMVSSFRRLSGNEAGLLRARQIEPVVVGPRDTLASMAKRMAYEDYQLDRFLALNGRDANTPLKTGEAVKIISYAR